MHVFLTAIVVVGSAAAFGIIFPTQVHDRVSAAVSLQAPADSYRCLVRGASEVGPDGVLVPAAQSVRKVAIGSTFVVERSSGRILGGVGNNETFESRTVVFTPPDNPYYVISVSHGPNKNVDYLSMRDWASGPRKPFLLAQGAWCTRGPVGGKLAARRV